MNKTFKQHLENLLKKDERLVDEQGELMGNKIKDLADKLDETFIETLLNDDESRKHFFLKIKDVYVFKAKEFKFYLEQNKLDNSFTNYANRIGLSFGGKYLKDNTDVVLNFPFKDCVLEGGQSTEEGLDTYYEYDEEVSKTDTKKGYKAGQYNEKQSKRKEIFFNEVIAKDEIDRLLEPKAFEKIRKYDANGESTPTQFNRDSRLNKQRGLPEDTITDNLIIKGNNLLALHSLKEEFKGKVKLIYIDPPYNTGDDEFAYNDSFNHSTWLTFMRNRLVEAKDLLKEEGVIFIHCDNNEQAYLKVLMDEVFLSSNFIDTITVVNNPRGRDYGGIANMHEFMHIYGKSSNYEMFKTVDNDKKFPFKDIISDFETRELRNRNTAFHDGNRPNLCYPFYVNPKSKLDNDFLELSIEPKDGFIKVMPAKSKGIQTVWRWGKPKAIENLNINIVGKSMQEEGRYMIVEKYRNNSRLARSVWWDKDVNSEKGTVHLRELFNEKVFDFPKPETLLTRILEITTNDGDLVLDYHLGSGTTATSAHKMNRQYIGVEQMNYIKTVTVNRLKKVIAGEQGGISKKANWQGGGSFLYLELAKNNQSANEHILNCKSFEELMTSFDALYDKYFLHYNVRIKEFKEVVCKEDNFKNLSLNQQQEIFCRILDNNQLYVNASEMEDTRYNISKEDIALTKDFYQIK